MANRYAAKVPYLCFCELSCYKYGKATDIFHMSISFPLSILLGVGWLHHMVDLFSDF